MAVGVTDDDETGVVTEGVDIEEMTTVVVEVTAGGVEAGKKMVE